MKWGSVKSLLIAVLLLVNIFMTAILASEYKKVNYIGEKYILEAVPLLAKKGVFVESELIPREKCAIMTQRLLPSGPAMTAFLKNMLNEKTRGQPEASFKNEYGSYETQDFIEFSLAFTPEKAPHFKNTREAARYIEKAACFDALELKSVTAQRGGDSRTVRFLEYAEGVLVDGCFVDVSFVGGFMTGISGRLILDESIVRLSQNSRNAVDALFSISDKFEGKNVTVTKIRPIIHVYLNTWGTHDSAPMYYVDTVERGAFVVDMMGKNVTPYTAPTLQ